MAELGVAKGLQVMSETMGEGKQEAIVGNVGQLERSAHLEAESAADQGERYVVERVAVAFAQFVEPDDRGMVEHGAVAARLGRFL